MNKRLRLSESNVQLLKFIWKWKLATTQILAMRFFPSGDIRSAYNRLSQLRKAGYLQVQYDKNGQASVWTLARRGFEAVRESLPPLRAEGYLSEHLIHDLVVQAFHLGDWVSEIPQNAQLVSEQELRCFEFEHLPGGVPQTDAHRPDGYWRIGTGQGQKTLALEVELNRKNLADYSLVGKFFDLNEQIHSIVWLVPKLNLANTIDQKIKSSISNPSNHNFILLDQFYELGWQAPVALGPDSGKTLSDLLQCLPKTTHEHVLIPSRIDARIFPRNSRSYKFYVSALVAD